MATRTRSARVGDDTYAVSADGHVITVTAEGNASTATFEAQYLGHGRLVLRRDDVAHPAWVVDAGDKRWVYEDGEVTVVEIADGTAARRGRPASGDSHPPLSAPMPATVLRLQVEVGSRVARGATLVLLEAMKMELPLRAPHDAVVTAIHCKEGEIVQPNVVLVELEAVGTER